MFYNAQSLAALEDEIGFWELNLLIRLKGSRLPEGLSDPLTKKMKKMQEGFIFMDFLCLKITHEIHNLKKREEKKEEKKEDLKKQEDKKENLIVSFVSVVLVICALGYFFSFIGQLFVSFFRYLDII